MAQIPESLSNFYNKSKPTNVSGTGLLSDVSTYTPAQVSVDKKQTVAGNVEDIINKDNPLQQQARTRALQESNRRGLLGSSLAVGAAQDAVVRNALPIAQQDAQTYAAGEQANAQYKNRALSEGSQAINQSGVYNAQTVAGQREAELSRGFEGSQAQLERELQERQAGLQRGFQSTEAQKERSFQSSESGLQRGFQSTEAQKERQFQSGETEKEYGFRSGEAEKERVYSAAEQQKLREFQKQQDQFAANVNASLKQIENEAKYDINTQSVFGTLSNDINQRITEINNNFNMTQEAKDYAIQQAFTIYKGQLSMLSYINAMDDVSTLLDPEFG